MDVGKSFTFVFEDKDWVVKVLIGAGILLAGLFFFWLLFIPTILAAALLTGYGLEITRRVIRGNPLVLPEWENWGALIVDGLKVMAIAIVWALPAIVVSVCLGVPAGILGDGGRSAQALGGLLSALLAVWSILWGIALSLVLPAAIARFADSGEINDGLKFGEVLALVRDHLGTYGITLLMSWVASIIGELGSIACGIGWLATLPYSIMVTGHLYGQAYVTSHGQPALPSTPAPVS